MLQTRRLLIIVTNKKDLISTGQVFSGGCATAVTELYGRSGIID